MKKRVEVKDLRKNDEFYWNRVGRYGTIRRTVAGTLICINPQYNFLSEEPVKNPAYDILHRYANDEFDDFPDESYEMMRNSLHVSEYWNYKKEVSLDELTRSVIIRGALDGLDCNDSVESFLDDIDAFRSSFLKEKHEGRLPDKDDSGSISLEFADPEVNMAVDRIEAIRKKNEAACKNRDAGKNGD